MKNLPQNTRGAKPLGAWHAVSVVARSASCQAALLCRNTRYLSAQAPRLPLPDCDLQGCSCTYHHHDDRRAGPRRSSEQGRPPRMAVPLTERRAARGRRDSDT